MTIMRLVDGKILTIREAYSRDSLPESDSCGKEALLVEYPHFQMNVKGMKMIQLFERGIRGRNCKSLFRSGLVEPKNLTGLKICNGNNNKLPRC